MSRGAKGCDHRETAVAKSSLPSPRQRSEAPFDPFGHHVRQGLELGTRFRFRLGDAGDHRGCLAVLGLAGELEARLADVEFGGGGE